MPTETVSAERSARMGAVGQAMVAAEVTTTAPLGKVAVTGNA